VTGTGVFIDEQPAINNNPTHANADVAVSRSAARAGTHWLVTLFPFYLSFRRAAIA
jgi:hypothetical protein